MAEEKTRFDVLFESLKSPFKQPEQPTFKPVITPDTFIEPIDFDLDPIKNISSTFNFQVKPDEETSIRNEFDNISKGARDIMDTHLSKIKSEVDSNLKKYSNQIFRGEGGLRGFLKGQRRAIKDGTIKPWVQPTTTMKLAKRYLDTFGSKIGIVDENYTNDRFTEIFKKQLKDKFTLLKGKPLTPQEQKDLDIFARVNATGVDNNYTTADYVGAGIGTVADFYTDFALGNVALQNLSKGLGVLKNAKKAKELLKPISFLTDKFPRFAEAVKDSVKFGFSIASGRALKRTSKEVGNAFRGEFKSLADSYRNITDDLPKDFVQAGALRLFGSYQKYWWNRALFGGLGGGAVSFLENKDQIARDLKSGNVSSFLPVIGTAVIGATMDALFPIKASISKKELQKQLLKLTKKIAKKSKLDEVTVQRVLSNKIAKSFGYKEFEKMPAFLDNKAFKLRKIEQLINQRHARLKQANPDIKVSAVAKEVKEAFNLVEDIKNDIIKGKPVKVTSKELLELMKQKRISAKELTRKHGVPANQVKNWFRKFVKTLSSTEEKQVEDAIRGRIDKKNTADKLIVLFRKEKRRLNRLHTPLVKQFKQLKSAFDLRTKKNLGFVRFSGKPISKAKVKQVIEYNKNPKNKFEILSFDNKRFAIRPKPGVKVEDLPLPQVRQELNNVRNFFKETLGKKTSVSFSINPDDAGLYSVAKSNLNKYLQSMKEQDVDAFKNFSNLDDVIFDDSIIAPDEAIIFNNLARLFKNPDMVKRYGNMYNMVQKTPMLKRMINTTLNSMKGRSMASTEDYFSKQGLAKALQNITKFENANEAMLNSSKMFKELRDNIGDDIIPDDVIRSAEGLENVNRNLIQKWFRDPVGDFGVIDQLFPTAKMGKKEYLKFADSFQRIWSEAEQSKGTVSSIMDRMFDSVRKELGVTDDSLEFYPLFIDIIARNELFRNKKVSKKLFMDSYRRMTREMQNFNLPKGYKDRLNKWFDSVDDEQFNDTVKKLWSVKRFFEPINNNFIKYTKRVNDTLGKKLGIDLGIEYFKDTDIAVTKKAIVKSMELDDRLLTRLDNTTRTALMRQFDEVVNKKGFNKKKLDAFIRDNDLGNKLKPETVQLMKDKLDVVTELFKRRRGFFPYHLQIRRDGFSLTPDKYKFSLNEQKKQEQGIKLLGSVYGDVLATDPFAVYTERFSNYIERVQFAKMLYAMRKMKINGIPVVVKPNKKGALPKEMKGLVRGQLEKFYVRLGSLVDIANKNKDSKERAGEWFILNPFARAIKEYTGNTTRNKVLGGLSSMISRLKVLKFYKPFILWRYGAEQNFLANPKSFLYFNKAIKGVFNKDEDYLTASQLGLFNRSIVYRDVFGNNDQELKNFVSTTKPSKNIIAKGLDKVVNTAKSVDKVYRKNLKSLQDIAWAGDEVARLMQYKSWIARGFSPQEAVKRTQLFAVHYDRWNANSRRLLNVLFRYPTYRIQMLRLNKEIAKGLAGKSDTLSRKDATQTLLRIGALKFAKIQALSYMGFTWGADFMRNRWNAMKGIQKEKDLLKWTYESLMEYRGFKTTGKGDEKRILGAVFSGPAEEIPKMVMRGAWGSFIMNLSDGMIIPYQIWNNRGDDWQPIIKRHSSPLEVGIQSLSYALKKYFPPITEWSQMNMEGVSAGQKILGALGFMNFIYYSDKVGEVKDELRDMQTSGRSKEDIDSQKIRLRRLQKKLVRFEQYKNHSFDKKFKWLMDDAFFDMKNLYKDFRESAENAQR
jgi:hypothetical protein